MIFRAAIATGLVWLLLAHGPNSGAASGETRLPGIAALMPLQTELAGVKETRLRGVSMAGESEAAPETGRLAHNGATP
jgi:hypothetical protein